MPEYIRLRTGYVYFFTVVTYNRNPILCLDESRSALRKIIDEVRVSKPFEINAWVLLPNHLHCIWTLPESDNDYSKRWGIIKSEFTKRIGKELVGSAHPTRSRIKKREGVVWQRRFWEHQIRNEKDYEDHFHYIHYNPVKHKYVKQAKDWKFSTFHKYEKQGIYSENWGRTDTVDIPDDIGGE